MTNNIVNCCENASSAFPNDHDNTNSGEANHRKASMEQHNQPNVNINNQNLQLNNNNDNINKQSNGHLVQMYPKYHDNDDHNNVNNDDYCTKSPYESTTISNHNIKNKKSPFSSMMATATSSSPYQNDDDSDDNNERQSHLNQISSSSSSNSIWNVIHMILVVIASASINGIVFGVVNNFGVFYAHLTELSKKDLSILGFNDYSKVTDDESTIIDSSLSINNTNNTDDNVPAPGALVQSLIAGVGSLNVGLIFFCSIFASVLSDRYGIRNVCFFGGVLATIGMYASSVSLNWIYLYVTYGLVLGIGASLVYGPSLAILGHYFTKRLGLVNGLVTAGSSAFSIVMPFALRWLIDQVGIQSTFKYLSILMATLILCSLTFKEQIKRPNQTKHASAKKNLANMFFYDALWKNNLYLYWVISIPMGLFGYFVPFCHLVKHAREINSFYQGEVLVMSIGVTSMLGRLITGPLADVSHFNRICLQQFAFASIGLLTMLLPFVRDFPLLLVCCGLGLFDGCFISLLGPIAFDLVGPEYANQAIGLLLCFCSLPLTTGPPIAAYAYGVHGNYRLAFCLAGIPPIFAALLMFNIVRLQRMQRRRTSTVKLGIDEPRCLFDESMIVNGANNDNISNDGNENNKQINNSLINGEKLHLLINGNDNNIQHPQHTKGINGTTKLTIPSLTNNHEDSGFNNNEKTGLLLNGDATGGNNIVILSKDHHHHHQPQQKPPQNSSSSSDSQSTKSSIRI